MNVRNHIQAVPYWSYFVGRMIPVDIQTSNMGIWYLRRAGESLIANDTYFFSDGLRWVTLLEYVTGEQDEA